MGTINLINEETDEEICENHELKTEAKNRWENLQAKEQTVLSQKQKPKTR